MSKEPKRNVYVGHRYVPLIMGEWDKTISYEGLSIVTYQGASYTSKKRVPVGIDIKDTEFWAMTGNYNAQVEEYRKEVSDLKDDFVDTKEDINKEFENTTKYIDSNIDTINKKLIKKADQNDLNYVTNKVNEVDRNKADKSSLNTKASYRYVDDEVKNINDRVNDIITRPAEGISEEEIIDARLGEDSLGENVSKIKDKTLPFYKELTRNPYFKYGSGESIRTPNATAEIIDEGLEVTGVGSFLNPSYRRFIFRKEDYNNITDVYYTNTMIKFIDYTPESFRLGFRDGDSLVTSSNYYNLKPNIWMSFSHLYEPTGSYQWEGDFNSAVESWYKDADDARNKKFIIKKVNTINVTEIFGSGNEPTQEILDKVFNYLESNTDNPSPSEIIKSIVRYEDVNKKEDKPYVFGELEEYYPSPEFKDMSDSSEDPLKDWVTQDIYDLYDSLWNDYPKRIERNFIGYASNSVGNDDIENPVYEYVFKPPYTKDNERGNPFTPPLKTLITTGVHGNEKGTVYTTYKMFENMMLNEFNPLTPLRLNIEFRVIPVVNPYGFNTTIRRNATGKDVNRDFLTSDVNEIKNVRNWVYKHGDAILLLDIHNTWMDSFGLTYGVAYQEHMREIYQGVTRTLSFDWSNKYGYEDNTTEGYTLSGGAGHIYYEGSKHTNIKHAILLETSADDHERVEYTSEVLERTYGLTTNFLRSFFNWLNNN